MEIEQLTALCPRLYHMAEKDSWRNIRRHGLLSTSALLDLFEIKGAKRKSLEAARRSESVPIEHKAHGVAIIRDQKPMSDAKLLGCLDGCGVADWYRLLNGKVFFWPPGERLRKMLNGKSYRDLEHDVLTLDGKALIERCCDRIRLSPINSGSTQFFPVKRGRQTFKPIAEYPFEERRRKRGARNAVAEVAVEYGVPDIQEFVLQVDRWRGGKMRKRIWRP